MFSGVFDEYINSGRNERFDIVVLSMILEYNVDLYNYISVYRNLCKKYYLLKLLSWIGAMKKSLWGFLLKNMSVCFLLTVYPIKIVRSARYTCFMIYENWLKFSFTTRRPFFDKRCRDDRDSSDLCSTMHFYF